jgi:hypothetical protein
MYQFSAASWSWHNPIHRLAIAKYYVHLDVYNESRQFSRNVLTEKWGSAINGQYYN